MSVEKLGKRNMLRFEQEEFISYLSKLVTHQEQASQGSNHELLASDCAVLPRVAKLFGGRPLGIFQWVNVETFASAWRDLSQCCPGSW